MILVGTISQHVNYFSCIFYAFFHHCFKSVIYEFSSVIKNV
jgi:hypothetical protein